MISAVINKLDSILAQLDDPPHACGCLGPNSRYHPVCSCAMENVVEYNGHWVQLIVHGPVDRDYTGHDCRDDTEDAKLRRIKEKTCSVFGCNDVRISGRYCEVHQNASDEIKSAWGDDWAEKIKP